MFYREVMSNNAILECICHNNDCTFKCLNCSCNKCDPNKDCECVNNNDNKNKNNDNNDNDNKNNDNDKNNEKNNKNNDNKDDNGKNNNDNNNNHDNDNDTHDNDNPDIKIKQKVYNINTNPTDNFVDPTNNNHNKICVNCPSSCTYGCDSKCKCLSKPIQNNVNNLCLSCPKDCKKGCDDNCNCLDEPKCTKCENPNCRTCK